MEKTVRDYVGELVSEHYGIAPEISRILWFGPAPDEDPEEIRLVEINPGAPYTGEFFPVTFGQSPDLPYRLVLAEVNPREWQELRDGILEFPPGWPQEPLEPFDPPAA